MKYEMKDRIKLIIFLTILSVTLVSAVKPYWNRYWLELQLEAVSIYGTKNSVEATRKYLNGKMEEEGYAFRADDFLIEKDENNRVSVTITYVDKIRLFGFTLREFELTARGASYDVKEIHTRLKNLGQ